MRRYRLIVLALILISTRFAYTQNDDCEITLTKATDEFNNGHFFSIVGILDPCLKSFTTEQKQRAYLLLAQTYLLMDDAAGARSSYLSLLKANPEFLTDTALHPIDVIYLSKKFTSTPIFSWFGKAGANGTMPRVIYDINPFGETGLSKKNKIITGFQLAIGGDYNFSDKINARLELQFDHNIFESTTENYWVEDKLDITTNQNWLSVPLTFSYGDFKGKYRPYGYFGYAFHYLLAEHSVVTQTNNRPGKSDKDDDRDETSISSLNINSRFIRNNFNQSVILGGGLKRKIGLDFVFIDLRYQLGLKNITNLDNLYSNNSVAAGSAKDIESQELSTRWSSAPDIMRLDNLSISVGFLRPLYKPRELKRARTKSVMKHMKN
jgi:hypothetical protein